MVLLNWFAAVFVYTAECTAECEFSGSLVDGRGNQCIDYTLYKDGYYPWSQDQCEVVYLMLDYVNFVRNIFAEHYGVQWMVDMQWNEELALKARDRADKCDIYQDVTLARHGRGLRSANDWTEYESSAGTFGPAHHGEVLKKGLKNIIRDIIDEWFAKRQSGKYSYAGTVNFPNSHWRGKSVGCGFSYFYRKHFEIHEKPMFTFFLVCNFYPKVLPKSTLFKGPDRNCEAYVPLDKYINHKIINSSNYRKLCRVPPNKEGKLNCSGYRWVYDRRVMNWNITVPDTLSGARSGLPTAHYIILTVSFCLLLLKYKIHL